MIGHGGIADFPIAGLIASGTILPLTDFVDPIATRQQRLIQPWPWLELYEIETDSFGVLRYVDFQDPDAGGTLPTQVGFNGVDFNSRKITRGDIKTADGVTQFPIDIEDQARELITAVDTDDGLNEQKVHIWRIPYDFLDKPQLASKETYRIRQALSSIGPDTVSLSVGLPSLTDVQVPVRSFSRNRCWNDFNRRFEADSHCRHPSDDFEEGTRFILGSDGTFSQKPTTWPRIATKRRFGWSSLNADIADHWETGGTAVAGSTELWTNFTSDHPSQKWGQLSFIDQCVTQDGIVFTDVTDDMNDAATTTPAFPAVPTTADAIYFASRFPFGTLHVNVDTAGVGAYTVDWQYFDGSSYVDIPGVTDNTNAFKTGGTNTVVFTPPADWAVDGADEVYSIRAKVATTGFTTVPVLRQAWTNYATHGLYMWKDISGNWDIETQVKNAGTRAQRMIGFLIQDPTDERDWIFWGNAENSSSVEKMRVRQSTNGTQADTDTDTSDGNEHIRITRVDDTFTMYAKPSASASWVQKSSKTWSGAPLLLRVGLVAASDVYDGATALGANFRAFLFNSGGFATCDRSEADCDERENSHQFNGFQGIPNQRTRG